MPPLAVSSPELETVPDVSTASKKRKSQIDEIEVDLNLPEPPSKRAKRLLKKGKPLPVKPSSDDEADEDGLPISSTKQGKGARDKKRSGHGIWVGNLSFTVTRVDLFKWLVDSSGGAIQEENITRVNLPKSKLGGRDNNASSEENPRPQNKGFAYVDFDTEAAAVAAMALTETFLSGRKVLIKNASSFEGRPQKESNDGTAEGQTSGVAGSTKANEASKKIYVGNLSFKVTEEDIRNHFDKCGEIDWVKVATFEDTGKCKGYGWVKFRDVKAAEWAVRGFVKIKEEVETEKDFKDEKEDDDDQEEEQEEGSADATETKKYKTRKWWVNRLHGRELKVDFAEDDQARYKKRFGRDRPQQKDRSNNGQGDAKAAANGEAKEPWRSGPPKAKGYGDDAVASYKTGAVVAPKGKKITFD